MNELKNVSICFGIALLSLLVFTFLMTLFNYVGVIPNSMVSIVEIVIPLLSLFIGGYLLGKKSQKKGWLQGLKLGILFILLLLLFQYLGLHMNFDVRNLVFYLLLMMSTIFGSMLGINRKKES